MFSGKIKNIGSVLATIVCLVGLFFVVAKYGDKVIFNGLVCRADTAQDAEAKKKKVDNIKDDIDDLNKKLEKKIKQKEVLEKNLSNVKTAVYLNQKTINNKQAKI